MGTGTDSPVIIASLTSTSPSSNIQSAGTIVFSYNIKTSLGTSWSDDIDIYDPFLRT